MANGRHARGAEHPTAQLDSGPARPEAPDLNADVPRDEQAPRGRRRRVIEELPAPVTGVPRQGSAQSTETASVPPGSGRRRRGAPENRTDPAAPLAAGRRRRSAVEDTAEKAAENTGENTGGRADSGLAERRAPAPVAAPGTGTGRRRRAPENGTEPAPLVDAAPRAEEPTPAPPVLLRPVVAAVESSPAVELAPRRHAAPAKKAAAGKAPAKAPVSKHAGIGPATGGHAAARRKIVALPAGTPSGTALIAGAAAVAVAAAGAIGMANSGSNLPATSAATSGASVLGLSEGGALVDSASVNREQARASRDLAREALANRVQAAAALQQKQEATARALAAAQARAQQLAQIAQNYSLPVSGYHLTAGFGQGGYHWSHGHTGLDFACAWGTPIHAVAAGTVIWTGWDGPYGWKTIIRHADGTETWYAHQSQILVHSGQVAAGQIIGRVGMTGNTTGPHVHLEVRINGEPVNPLIWLRAHGLNP